MLQFCSLYSGSTGNSLFIQSDNTKVLVDAGVSAKKITEALNSISVDVSSLDAILVTHEHIDHVKSLSTLSTKYNIPVFATSGTWDAMPENKAKIALQNQKSFKAGDKFEMHAELIKIKGPIVKVHAKGFVDGQLAVEADLLVSLLSKPE